MASQGPAGAMTATVQLVDVGLGRALRSLVRPARVGDVRGLRWMEAATAFPFRSGPPPLRRAALVGFWDNDAAVDDFEQSHPLAERFAGGFHCRLRPLRAMGAWPGLPPEVPTTRAVPHEGPVGVLTMNHVRWSQAARFMRASRPAERNLATAEGLIWAAALARLPFSATLSFWRSGRDAAAYAYGAQRPQHREAIAEQQRKDFFRRSAFIRFAPTRVSGAVGPHEPLDAAMFGPLPVGSEASEASPPLTPT
jgi:hypothetical protein